MTFRYNLLRRLGWRTVSGINFYDPDFGDQWTELSMRKGKRLKRVRVANMTVSEVMKVESLGRA